jgi:hypothetical protein
MYARKLFIVVLLRLISGSNPAIDCLIRVGRMVAGYPVGRLKRRVWGGDAPWNAVRLLIFQ